MSGVRATYHGPTQMEVSNGLIVYVLCTLTELSQLNRHRSLKTNMSMKAFKERRPDLYMKYRLFGEMDDLYVVHVRWENYSAVHILHRDEFTYR